MKDREIFERTIPEPTTLLGLRLKPLALGHLILLHRVESAFMLGGEQSYDDLALSVFICSRSYEEALEAFDDPGLPREMERWAKKLTKRGPIHLPVKCKEFVEYLDRNDLNFKKDRDFVCEEDRTRKVALPMVHTIRAKLQSRMHFSDSEIMNRSWALCLLDYFILLDSDGVVQLTDKDALKIVVEEAQAAGAKLLERIKEGKVKWQ